MARASPKKAAASSPATKKTTKTKAPAAKHSKSSPAVERKKKRVKKEKDPNAPKRAQVAYMIWLGENRSKIMKPGMAVTDVAKEAGALWRAMKDKSKWEKMAAADKERYAKEFAAYQKKGGGSAPSSPKKAAAAKGKKK